MLKIYVLRAAQWWQGCDMPIKAHLWLMHLPPSPAMQGGQAGPSQSPEKVREGFPKCPPSPLPLLEALSHQIITFANSAPILVFFLTTFYKRFWQVHPQSLNVTYFSFKYIFVSITEEKNLIQGQLFEDFRDSEILTLPCKYYIL